MEHVMEFKLHLRDTYKNKKIQKFENNQNEVKEKEYEKEKSLQKYEKFSNDKVKKI